jgi:hypothetical protein
MVEKKDPKEKLGIPLEPSYRQIPDYPLHIPSLKGIILKKDLKKYLKNLYQIAGYRLVTDSKNLYWQGYFLRMI